MALDTDSEKSSITELALDSGASVTVLARFAGLTVATEAESSANPSSSLSQVEPDSKKYVDGSSICRANCQTAEELMDQINLLRYTRLVIN